MKMLDERTPIDLKVGDTVLHEGHRALVLDRRTADGEEQVQLIYRDMANGRVQAFWTLVEPPKTTGLFDLLVAGLWTALIFVLLYLVATKGMPAIYEWAWR